jgi:hypothetical protein
LFKVFFLPVGKNFFSRHTANEKLKEENLKTKMSEIWDKC